MDGFVLLTPLVVLAVIGLLGFTGCHSVFDLDHVDVVPPPPPPSTFLIEARVPAAFTIVQARLIVNRPETPTINDTETNPARTPEGDKVVLSRTVTDVTEGMWRAACRLTVREGAVEVEDVAPVDFFLDPVPGPNGVVRFETKGSPIAGDFKVVALGFQPA